MRPRPPSLIPPLIKLVPGNSFPSGHAIFWAVSIVAALRYARGYLGGYVPLIFGVMGAWMCLSRIVGGTHYPLDIIGGFVIGIVAGLIFVTIERRV